MYALIENDTIIQVGNLPAIWNDGTRYWDLRTRDETLLNSLGWHEVVTQPRPGDTETTTHDQNGPVLIDGVPTITWTERDKTESELQAEEDSRVAEERRQSEVAIIDATIALMENAHESGEAWVQPTGAHDAYRAGIIVNHNGKTWENLTPANVWEPGVTGWREVAVDGPVAWIQPLGAYDSYPLGATVTHNEQTWESTVANNVWEPGVYGWVVV